MPKLLCVTAHPDDEAGAFGGTLALYANRGVQTHLVCLTTGQAATHRGMARSGEELSELRRAELQESCRILRISGWELLDYPDGGLDRTDFYAVAGELTRRVREIRPDIMLTLGPEGAVTGHPDHSMASLFATMAYHWAGRTDRYREQLELGLQAHRTPKLYYGTASFTLPDRQPVSLPPATAVIDITGFVETKIQAFRSHCTQAPLFERFESAVRELSEEWFHLAASTTPSLAHQENDLFNGILERV
jgi:LmbE family N-acetylglucosaminyl deacetylase